MINNNKILTVSYGTFSCTLEGFDDSFGTMKAIAEYFRDLASDDRYFGAEPPQPDAEMLSRIAQKEISRRVDVREHEGKIVLSATAMDTASDDQATDVAITAPPVADPETNAKAEAMIEAEAARAAKAQAAEAAEIARVQAEAKAKEQAQAERATQERQNAERLEAERAQAAKAEADRSQAQAQEEVAVLAPSETAKRDLAAELPEAEAFFAKQSQDDEPLDIVETAEDVAPVKPVQDDSIAAKLQRIRAVVSNAEHANDDDDFSEDEHAVDFDTNTKVSNASAAQVEETADVEDFDIADFSVDTSDETAPHADVKAEAIADIQAASEADALADATADQAEMEDDDMSSILARLEENDQVEVISEETAAEENLFDDSVYADDGETLDIEDEVAAEEVEAVEPRRIARVIKVKRADLEAAIAQGDLEEVEDDFDDTDEDDAISTTLSDEDEAELARDLADVEELEDDGESLFEDETFEEADQSRAALGDNDGDDLSRLLAEADQQMDDEEGKQSRDAFAHLRAAVAAKNADSGLEEPTAEEEEVAYRGDLATVVKPRRPAAAGRSERPTTISDRPAPLKLVAEQRVDAADADTRGPVRPRRVALQAAPAPADADSFVEYAEDMGASELPDLLEAAASYMSFVEGREQFSRPQLMNKVRSVEKENFSREDGLRSFGKLLRAGKIEKIKGGRFTVTSDIGYRPDARAAG